jgi:putative transposase
MPRANRYFVPGYVWHITHRCHKQEFLLKFAKDRRTWVHWLFEARKRFGLCVLNYIVTSNHTHLLVKDSGRGEIPKSIQLVDGRTAQQYNQRKKRKGAFWNDRYHATAVATDEHLMRCLVYIDLNMVRAGVVKHPCDWAESGYGEIQGPRKRYAVIDTSALLTLLNCRDLAHLQTEHAHQLKSVLASDRNRRDACFSESLAVGNREFVEEVRRKLGAKARARSVVEEEDTTALREPRPSYGPHFGREKAILSPGNNPYTDRC